MTTAKNHCEGCTKPAAGLQQRDLEMPDRQPISATLCPDCCALEDGDDTDGRISLFKTVQARRWLKS